MTCAALATLRGARLGYRGATAVASRELDLTIRAAASGVKGRPGYAFRGGHALLGNNGHGKTLVASALLEGGDGLLHAGHITRPERCGRVSFESHQELLANGGTVYKALGHLNAATKFLVVRFGLHPLLYRPVRSISTGEIRKVLLARTLGTRPQLLVLDNAFDGLDVPSRETLKTLISQTLRGFGQLLVQGVDASATAHTQVLLLTHRAEELVPEISSVSWLAEPGGELLSAPREGRDAADVMREALGADGGPAALPSASEVAELWGAPSTATLPAGAALVEARALGLVRGEAQLLTRLEWTVRPGENWLVAGGNGAGKSTLSALLASGGGEALQGSLHVLGRSLGPATDAVALGGGGSGGGGGGVGWVSTELHLRLAQNAERACDVVSRLGGGGASEGAVVAVARWLGVHELLGQPFNAVSQGEQKLLLICAAIAARPALLVLDEVCQGLDAHNRRRVLGLLQRIGEQRRHTSLVFITHHPDEVLPCLSHVLHMSGGSAAFLGERKDYDPSAVAAAIEEKRQ